jgi:hypothetical protein
LYGVVNPILTFVMPGSFERFLLAEERMFPGADFSGLAMTILRAGHVLSLVAGVGVSLVALYFLWTRREAFARPQIASGAEGASNEGGAA